MTIAYVSGGASSGTTSSTTTSIPYATGVPASGVLIMGCSNDNNGTTEWATPSGWTQLYVNDNVDSQDFLSMGMWWKAATGTESGSISVTNPTAGYNSGVMVGYGGCAAAVNSFVETGSAVATSATSPGSGGTLSPAVPSNGMVVRFYFFCSDASVTTETLSTPASPWSVRERYTNTSASSYGVSVMACDQYGTTSAAPITASGGAGSWIVAELWLSALVSPIPTIRKAANFGAVSRASFY